MKFFKAISAAIQNTATAIKHIIYPNKSQYLIDLIDDEFGLPPVPGEEERLAAVETRMGQALGRVHRQIIPIPPIQFNGPGIPVIEPPPPIPMPEWDHRINRHHHGPMGQPIRVEDIENAPIPEDARVRLGGVLDYNEMINNYPGRVQYTQKGFDATAHDLLNCIAVKEPKAMYLGIELWTKMQTYNRSVEQSVGTSYYFYFVKQRVLFYFDPNKEDLQFSEEPSANPKERINVIDDLSFQS